MVIFDLDGTLWDSTVHVAESWNILLKRETGKDAGLRSSDIRRNMGKTMDQIADDIFGYLPPDERYALARKCERFENEYITEHGGTLYDGVEETLAMLNGMGVSLAVVSNCQEGYVKAFLDSMDMWKYFTDYEEWGRTMLLKADNVRLVMDRNHEDKAVYVGDIQNDANSAHEAGIPCIWASYGFGEIADAEGVLSRFDELPDVLKKLGFV